MKTRTLIYLYLLALGMLLIVASFQFTPGYMDAEYYFLGGQRLAAGGIHTFRSRYVGGG